MNLVQNHQCLIFGLVWVTYCVTYCLRKPLGIIKPKLELDLSLTKTQLGWLDLALLLPYSGVQILCSNVWDRIPPRYLIALCLSMASLAMMMIGIGNSFYVICVCLFISGAGQAPLWPACTKMLSSWFVDSRLSSVFGIISTSQYAGALLGTGLAIYIQEKAGWPWVYVPAGIAGLVMATFNLLFLLGPKDMLMEIPGKTYVSPTHLAKDKKRQSYAFLLSIPGVADVTMAVFCLKFVRYCMHMWLPLYLIDHLKYSQTAGGIFSTMFDVGGILGGPILGLLVDHCTNHQPLWGIFLMLMLGTVCFILIAFIASWGTIYCSSLLLMVGAANCGPDSLLTGSVTMMIGEKYGSNTGAGVTSLVNGIGSIGAIVEGPIIGLISQKVGWHGVMGLMITLSFFAMLSTLRGFLVLKLHDRALARKKAEDELLTLQTPLVEDEMDGMMPVSSEQSV